MAVLNMADVELAGQRVFIRSDLNVPQNERGTITDDTRIKASIPAIRLALESRAAVMVTSHLGRPTEGKPDPKESLAPVAERLSLLLGRRVALRTDWVGGVEVTPGEVVLLENCRFNKGEKKNDEALGRSMAALCDVYVNAAFATAHRAEATTHAIARFAPVACAGPLMAAELEALAKGLGKPARPLLAIVAGSKVSTKLDVLQSLSAKVDQLIVGGGILNTFLLASGSPVGKSLVEADLIGEAKHVMDRMAEKGGSVPLPTDVVVAKEFSASARPQTKAVNRIEADDMILDVGPESAARLAELAKKAG